MTGRGSPLEMRAARMLRSLGIDLSLRNLRPAMRALRAAAMDERKACAEECRENGRVNTAFKFSGRKIGSYECARRIERRPRP